MRRERQALYQRRRRRGLCDLRARRRRDRADQHVLVRARAPRRPRDLPGRRHAGLGGGRPRRTAGASTRVNTPRPVWNPDVPQTDQVLRHAGRRCRACRSTTTASRSQWEDVHPPSSYEDAPFKWTLLEGAKGVQLVEAGAEELEGAPLDRRSGAEGLIAAMSPLRRGKMQMLATCPPPAAGSPLTRCSRRSSSRSARSRRSTAIAYAAAHVVADPLADNDPWLDQSIDWDATMAFRRHLWSLGPRRGRGDGHRAARHGHGLAELAGADPARASTPRRTCPAR